MAHSPRRYIGRPPGSRRDEPPATLPPVDIHERIKWKRAELQRWRLQAEASPHDLVVRGVISRLADELGAMEAVRDNRTWRRNG